LILITVGCLVLANTFLLGLGLTCIRIFSKIVEIPKHVIIPVIIVLSVIGSYAINNSITEIYWMIGFGILGYFFKMYDYPLATMVLGVILGPIIDNNFRRAVNMTQGNWGDFILSFFVNPITLVLLLFTIVMVLSQSKVKDKFVGFLKGKLFAKA